MKHYYKYPNTKITVAKGISLHNDRSWVFHPGKGSRYIRTYDADPVSLARKVNLPKSVISNIPNNPNIVISEYTVVLSSPFHKTLSLEWRFDNKSMASFSLALNEALKVNTFLSNAYSLTSTNLFNNPLVKSKIDTNQCIAYLYPNKRLTLPLGFTSNEENNWVYLEDKSHDDVFGLCKEVSISPPLTVNMGNIPSVTVNNYRVTLKTKLHTNINISWPFQKNLNSSFNAAIHNAVKAKNLISQLKSIVGYDVFKEPMTDFKAA